MSDIRLDDEWIECDQRNNSGGIEPQIRRFKRINSGGIDGRRFADLIFLKRLCQI
jgi:hypothetical protein